VKVVYDDMQSAVIYQVNDFSLVNEQENEALFLPVLPYYMNQCLL